MVKIVPWLDGSGNITLTYDGQGDGSIVISSDPNNLGVKRSQSVDVIARDKTRVLTINQLPNIPLPYDAEIEYIQIAPFQYINLPVRVSSNLISEIDCTIDNTNGNVILWNRYQGNNPQYAYSVLINQAYEDNSLRADYGSGDSSYRNYFDNLKNFVGNAHIVFGNGRMVFNGTELALSNSAQVFTSPLDYYTIGYNSDSYNSPWKLVHWSVSEDDTLIIDLIPVRVGTTGYLYDRVSGQLFGNDGTGSFILGPDKN